MTSNVTGSDVVAGHAQATEKQLPIKVLFIPEAARIFPEQEQGIYDRSDQRDAYSLGQYRYRSAAVQYFEMLVATFVNLGLPVSEMKAMQLTHRLGNEDWRNDHRGEIIVCRFDDDNLIEELWNELRDRGVGTEQVTMTRYVIHEGKAQSFTLDEVAAERERLAMLEAEDARIAACSDQG